MFHFWIFTVRNCGGEDYDGFLDQCNASFGLAIKKGYCDFVVIGKPIIIRVVVDGLVELDKSKVKTTIIQYIWWWLLKRSKASQKIAFDTEWILWLADF